MQIREVSFKVGTRERGNNSQANHVGKQILKGDVNWSILIIKKSGLKEVHFKCKHRNKGVPSRKERIMRKALVPFLGNEHSWVSLWSDCTIKCAAWGANKKLDVSVQLQGYELTTEAEWDNSHKWSAAVDRYRFHFRTDRMGQQEGRVSLYVREAGIHRDLPWDGWWGSWQLVGQE